MSEDCDCGCGVVAAVAAAAAANFSQKFVISIHYKQGVESIDAYWRDGSWFWVLYADGRTKGCGYCATAAAAIQTAFAAASFTAKIAVENEPLEPEMKIETSVAAQAGRHYRQADIRSAR